MTQQDNPSDVSSNDELEIATFVEGLASGRRDQTVCSANITRLRDLEQRGDVLTAVVDMRGAPHGVALLRIVTTKTGEQRLSPAVRTFLQERRSLGAPGYVGMPMGGEEFLYCFDPLSAAGT